MLEFENNTIKSNNIFGSVCASNIKIAHFENFFAKCAMLKKKIRSLPFRKFCEVCHFAKNFFDEVC